MDAAWLAYEEDDYVLSIYLGGLAVECILQALALRSGARHDARHNLAEWLARCPASVRNALMRKDMREHWAIVAANWHNRLRYLSRATLLGYLRSKTTYHRLKGDELARMKAWSRAFLEAARRVHGKGVSQWSQPIK